MSSAASSALTAPADRRSRPRDLDLRRRPPATEPGGHNRTVRRGGFPTEDDARTALHRYRAGRRIGVSADPNQTAADYLNQWPAANRLRLKPTTWVRYRDYVHHDLIPTLGPIRLHELAYEHLHHYVQAQLAAGRGPPPCGTSSPARSATPPASTGSSPTSSGPP